MRHFCSHRPSSRRHRRWLPYLYVRRLLIGVIFVSTKRARPTPACSSITNSITYSPSRCLSSNSAANISRTAQVRECTSGRLRFAWQFCSTRRDNFDWGICASADVSRAAAARRWGQRDVLVGECRERILKDIFAKKNGLTK